MKIRYVGPKDAKRFEGQLFPRLAVVDVPNTTAARLLADPMSFLPAEQEVPAETLAQRDALPLAMEREGQDRIEQYRRQRYQAEMLPQGSIDEKSGNPDATMQKRIDSIKGAQDEIDAGQKLIDQAKTLRARIASEKVIAAAGPDDDEPNDDLPDAAVKSRGRRKSEAIAI